MFRRELRIRSKGSRLFFHRRWRVSVVLRFCFWEFEAIVLCFMVHRPKCSFRIGPVLIYDISYGTGALG